MIIRKWLINSMDTCNCLVTNDTIDLVLIVFPSLLVKMHAEYNESRQYLPHRTVQSYQLSQFIQHLTQPTDTVIVCGDMNCEPSQLCYRVIKDVTGLVDAWDKHGKVKVIPYCLVTKKCVTYFVDIFLSKACFLHGCSQCCASELCLLLFSLYMGQNVNNTFTLSNFGVHNDRLTCNCAKCQCASVDFMHWLDPRSPCNKISVSCFF